VTGTILVLTAAYALVGILLVLVLLGARVPLLLRGIAAVATAGLMVLTYRGIGELRGLPSDAPPPKLFRLHWARIVEPDKLSGDPGSVFLWLEELDAQNYPSGLPRAHRLPYSRELAESVETALVAISEGEEVGGEVADDVTEEDTGERLQAEVGERQAGTAEVAVGERFLRFDFGEITFGAVPAPVTPEKSR
jgi:hypothetical protein